MAARFVAFVVCFWLFSMGCVRVRGSSIPMWEYLSKDEKTSYLYSMFKNQVEEFCRETKLENCEEEITKYGLQKLKAMPEDHLDEMDPYQRGANSIIWENMMSGHSMMKTTRKHPTTTTTTPQPNSYDDASFGDEDFGESARIETVYRLPPPKGFLLINRVQESLHSGAPLYVYPPNGFGKGTTLYFKYPATTLTPPRSYEGGYVSKVYPDGSPVKEGENALPQDEDLRQYMLSKALLPNY